MPQDTDQIEDVPENFERQVLALVLWADQDPCTVEQLSRNGGDIIVALDALSIVSDCGLIHRQGDHVFPTRAVLKVHDLFGAGW